MEKSVLQYSVTRALTYLCCMHSWGVPPARWRLHPLFSLFLYTSTRHALQHKLPVMYLFADIVSGFQYSFSSSVWSQVVHVNIIVPAVLKHSPLPNKQWSCLTTSLYSLVSHEPGEIGHESTKYISAPSESLQIQSSEDVFQSSLLSRPLCTTHTHIQNGEN